MLQDRIAKFGILDRANLTSIKSQYSSRPMSDGLATPSAWSDPDACCTESCYVVEIKVDKRNGTKLTLCFRVKLIPTGARLNQGR